MAEKDTNPELLLEAALTATQEIQAKYWRTKVLAALAPYLPEALVEKALTVARRIEDRSLRGEALAALTPYLSEALVEKTLTLVRKIERGVTWQTDRFEAEAGKAKALSALVLRLAELGHLSKALTLTHEIKSSDLQEEVLAELVSRLVKLDQLEAGLAVARKIVAEKQQVKALAVLAAQLTEFSQLMELLNITHNIRAEDQRVEALKAIAPHLPKPLLEKALNVALRIRAESRLAEALAAIAPHLPKQLLKKALVAAQAIKDDDQRAKAQAALASRLAELGQIEEALNVSRNILAENWQAAALAGLTPYLSEPLKGEVLEYALNIAWNIKSEIRREKGLTALVPWLIQFGRFEEALAIAQGMKFDYWRAEALTQLTSGLTELAEFGQIEKTLVVAAQELRGTNQAKVLVVLVSCLVKSERFEEALAIARSIESKSRKVEVLAVLVPWLTKLSPTTRYTLQQEILQFLEEATDSDEELLLLRTLSPVLVALGSVEVVAETFHLLALKMQQTPPPWFLSGEVTMVGVENIAGKLLEQEVIQVKGNKGTYQALAKLVRYPNLDCPDRTLVNQKFSLFIQLLIEPPHLSVEAVEVEDTGALEQLPEVEVVLRARGFDIEGSNTLVLQVERDDDSEERFILIPRCLGEQQIRVDFYQHGRRIGTVRHNVSVMEKLVNMDVPQPQAHIAFELKTEATVPAPDLELCVELDRHDGRTLYFTLHSTKEAVGYHHANFGQVTLKGSPLEKVQAVYQEVSRLATPVKQTEQAPAERRLATLGCDLWDELIPDKLKQEYWRFKSRVKSILITSDEPWVPWEMMKPYRYNDEGEREDGPFWSQQFALSRWLSGPGTADELLVGVARSVAPTQVNLLSVQEEIAFIKKLSDLHSAITVLEPCCACQEVLPWLENEKFFMVHFACHGMFDTTSPDNSAIKLSDGILRPSDIRVRFGGRRSRPLLFINACHGARTEFSFTGLGGWAERLVKDAHVGAFVGAMWEVNDGLALRFAQRFYTGLLKNNETIAEAFRQAREEIRQLAPYNSTWLAYTLYADPEGRIKDGTGTATVSRRKFPLYPKKD